MSGIIKSGSAPHDQTSPHQSAFNFDDMNSKANQYIEEVRAKANSILADAKEEAIQIKQSAKEQGKQAAMQAAEETLKTQIERQMQQLMPALDNSLRSIEAELDQWLKHWEGNLLSLAIAIAEKVIHREVKHHPEITLDLIKEALNLATKQDEIKLHVNPNDYELLKDQVDEIVQRLGKLAATSIVSDNGVTSGGCLVTTNYGQIDMQLESQLERIEAELS